MAYPIVRNWGSMRLGIRCGMGILFLSYLADQSRTPLLFTVLTLICMVGSAAGLILWDEEEDITHLLREIFGSLAFWIALTVFLFFLGAYCGPSPSLAL